MRHTLSILLLLPLIAATAGAQKKAYDATFYSYIDSDLCATLMLGPVTDERRACSGDTFKKGSNPVVVRADDNWVFQVKNQKTVKKEIGNFAQVTGRVKEKAGTIKIASLKTVEQAEEHEDL